MFYKNLEILFILQIIDMIGGLTLAYNNGNIESSIFKKGIIKKFATWLAVSVTILIDKWIGLNVITYAINSFIAYELLSIFEVLNSLGITDFLPEEITSRINKDYKNKG